MSTQNALQLASNIQSRVGGALLSVNSMLPPPEAAAVTLQAGGGSLGVFLLRDLINLQDKTYQCVEKVAHILNSQLDLAEDAKRRARDQAAELKKEKKPVGVPTVGRDPKTGKFTKLNDNLDDIEDAVNKGTIADLITGGLTAAMLAPGALKNLGKGLAKRLLKGGLYGAIAGFVANPIINYVDENFDLELSEDAKKEIKLSMIGAGTGFALAGIPGAIIGATAPMIGKVASYIAGNLNADQIEDKDFAGTAIAGAAAGYWTTGKLAGLMAMSKFGSVKTLGLALGATPVMIGVGAAVALGVGAAYLAKKIDEYQELTLDKLDKTTKKLDKEMGEWAAREEEGLFERMGINLGRLSALGEAKVASAEAFEQVGQNKEKFLANTEMQSKLSGLAGAMLRYSDDAITQILQDQTKSRNFLNTVENIKAIAANGGFGEDSADIFEAFSAFSDRVQNHAIKMVESGGDISNVGRAVARNEHVGMHDRNLGGDKLENLKVLQDKLPPLEQEKLDITKKLEAERVKLQKLNDEGVYAKLFGENEAELTGDRIKDLEELLKDKTSQIGRIEKGMNKLGTINGMLYNLDQLRELYKDNPDRLQEMIERSVNQSGADFMKTQQETKTDKNDGINTAVSSQTNVSNNAVQNNYVEKLNIHGDPYIAREGYSYGP